MPRELDSGFGQIAAIFLSNRLPQSIRLDAFEVFAFREQKNAQLVVGAVQRTVVNTVFYLLGISESKSSKRCFPVPVYLPVQSESTYKK